MDIDFWLRAVVVMLLLVLSAFFSSVESAYFSLSRSTLDQLRESADPRAKRAARLMDNPRRLLAVILSGNTIVITAAAAIAALIATDLAVVAGVNINLAIAIEVAVMSAVILFVAELFPKFMALRNPENWALKTSSAIRMVSWFMLPVAAPLSWFTTTLSQLMGVEQQSVAAMSESEIRTLVKVGHEHGVLEAEERRMIHSIFEFGDTVVREVMVPRIDIICVEANIPIDELLETVIKHGHSRIPVYEDTIDNIIGLIFAKDLLDVIHGGASFNLKKILRKTHFVPEEKKIDDLLSEFQSQKVHMALIVDEYGGIAGLVTMEDIIEEIVGEIQDEYDTEQPLMKKVDERTLLANGRLTVSDFNEEQGFELIPDSEAYETVAGFIYSQLGVVPKTEQKFEYNGYHFIVDEVHGKRITRIRVVKESGVFEGLKGKEKENE